MASVSGFVASLGAYFGFKKAEKAEPQPIVQDKIKTYRDDVEQLIGIEREKDYGCALMRSQRDETVLGIYLKRFDELEEDKKTVVSRMVNRVLENPKYEDLPADYPEKIKKSVSLDFSKKDYSFNGEESVDRIIEGIRQSEAKKLEEAGEVKDVLINLGYTIQEVQNMSARQIADAIKAQTADTEEQSDSITQLQKDYEARKISTHETVTKLQDIVKNEINVNDKDYDAKMDKIIDLLVEIDKESECICKPNSDETVSSDLNERIGV